MAEAFRNLLNVELVQRTSHHLQRVWSAFPSEQFTAQVLDGFEDLAMKARAMRISDVLQSVLPSDFEAAVEIIEASLRPVRGDEALSELRSDASGLAGWVVWSLGEFVARRGQDHPQRALSCLHALTQRFSAEFAIRPFLIRHPTQVYAVLESWLADPSPHVRRLISEGSRPRLPWGLALPAAIADPSPAYPLLRALQDDPSEYVRRSVANHLNDIAREHPQRLLHWLQDHLPAASAQRRAVLRHASRTLIKRGDAQVLAAWGLGQAFVGQAQLHIDPSQLRIGEQLELQVDLHSAAKRTQTLQLDYVVHHRRADGKSSPKVFKGWSLLLEPGERKQLRRQHSFRPISTRRYYPGTQRIALQINGEAVAEVSLELLDER